MDDTVIEYLKTHINRSDSCKELLRIYTNITESRQGSMFVYTEAKNYDCICHMEDGSCEEFPGYISFNVDFPVKGLIIGDDETVTYKTPYHVSRRMIIPVITDRDTVGVIILTNSIKSYSEETMFGMTSVVSLSQLIMWKHKILIDYKKVCMDNSKRTEDIFLANIGHEIRSPLNGVIGYAQLLSKTTLTDIQNTYINSMNGCGLQLMQIINDVIDFSKITAGKMPTSHDFFKIKDIFDSLTDATIQNINNKKQNIRHNISDDVPEYIVGDKHKVIQILVNLVTNANKFTQPGGSIGVSVSKASEELLRISVKDNGIGISEKDQCKLFSSFAQVDSNSPKTGSGLGLAISKKLAELMGGTINVQSSVDFGSNFTFTFKYQSHKDFEKIISTNMKELRSKKVLVVDDNVDNRIVLSEILYEWEMVPVICASAKEAMVIIRSNRHEFSLVLLDIYDGGSELAKNIRDEFPLLPLIWLSSDENSDTNTDIRIVNFMNNINKIQLFNSIHTIITKSEIKSLNLSSDDETNSDSSLISTSMVDINCKVLIVEDIDYNRALLSSMLRYIGYDNIKEACDGKHAYDAIKESVSNSDPYKIMLLDLRMPNMDGYDVIRSMKNNGWELPRIIVVTASVMESDREKCRDMGVKYFLNKPIEITQLREIMLTLSVINN